MDVLDRYRDEVVRRVGKSRESLSSSARSKFVAEVVDERRDGITVVTDRWSRQEPWGSIDGSGISIVAAHMLFLKLESSHREATCHIVG